jgi:outer membrane protein OmpA-like peptidoglycan-associated protein
MVNGLIPLLLAVLTAMPEQAGAAGATASERIDIFALASGAVLVSNTPSYAGWDALLAIDGSGQTGWSSPHNQPNGHIFVIELSQPYTLSSIAFDNTASQESSHPGISARTAEVWISTASPTAGFAKIATLEIPKGARKEFPLKGVKARWVKLVVVQNWGNAQYTELMEVEGYGEPASPAPSRPSISGVFQTNYGLLRLVQRGASVSGCYYAGDGILQGASDGRMVSFEWRQGKNKDKVGTAVMVLNAAGDYLNGLWYSGGVEQGIWAGRRMPNAGNPCTPPGADTLATDLRQSGRAILYGIHFASDSAVITADSGQTLEQVLAFLQSRSSTRLRIEGYTDSTNTDAYNLDLSKRRAQVVVSWLVGHGIPASRLTAEGFGKEHPVADNLTPQGRALNRRVEIALAP